MEERLGNCAKAPGLSVRDLNEKQLDLVKDSLENVVAIHSVLAGDSPKSDAVKAESSLAGFRYGQQLVVDSLEEMNALLMEVRSVI